MNELQNKIGLAPNQEYFDQLCFSIIDDLENNNFHWEGNEFGVHLTINGQSVYIPNEANEEEEIKKLWKQAKKKSSAKGNRSTSESRNSSES